MENLWKFLVITRLKQRGAGITLQFAPEKRDYKTSLRHLAGV